MKFHPVCNLFPEMPSDEFDALVSDIRANGVVTPAVLCRGEMIDGRHRWKAAKLAGQDCPTRDWEPAEGQSVVAYAISLNAKRRHLTASQLAVVALEALPLIEAESAARQKKGTLASTEAKVGKSTQIAASATGASRASVERAKAVQKAAPEKIEQVRAGTKTLHAAEKEVKAEAAKSGPPKRVKDEAGRVVTDKDVLEVLAQGETFDQIIRDLQAANRDIGKLCKDRAGARLHSQEIQAFINNAINAIKFGRPYTTCPLMPNCTDGSCKWCKGAKFVTENQWKLIPKELKS